MRSRCAAGCPGVKYDLHTETAKSGGGDDTIILSAAFNNQRLQDAAIHMEIARHANYPFARQTTKGLIQSTDKFAHSKNAVCSSQNRRWLRRRMVASEMAIYASPSDQFNSRSNRTMIGRCGNWTRMPQGGNMPVSLKTQAERTAKTPVTARRARVGGLCGFQDTVERVPAGSPKTGRCTAVRERCGNGKRRRRTPAGGFRQREKPQAAKQDKAAGSCASRGGHICPPCGQFRRFARGVVERAKIALLGS